MGDPCHSGVNVRGLRRRVVGCVGSFWNDRIGANLTLSSQRAMHKTMLSVWPGCARILPLNDVFCTVTLPHTRSFLSRSQHFRERSERESHRTPAKLPGWQMNNHYESPRVSRRLFGLSQAAIAA